MAKLAGCEVYPGDCVYDLCYGPGTVTHVEACAFFVSFGCRGRSRKYNEKGMTGKNSYDRTLYWHKPVVVELPKGECNAHKIRCALTDLMPILHGLTQLKCCPNLEKPEPEEDCGC